MHTSSSIFCTDRFNFKHEDNILVGKIFCNFERKLLFLKILVIHRILSI